MARKRYATIITEMRAPHECPQCHITGVKRLSVGIWLCRRCGFKFAGGAYAPTTKLGQIAERASRAGVASRLLAEQKAEKAKEAEAKAKTARKRRRKAKAEKTAPEKPTEKATEKVPQEKPESDEQTDA